MSSASRAAPDFRATTCQPFVRSALAEGEAALRTRFERDGYLFLPRLLREDLIQPVLDEVLAVLAPHVVWDRQQGSPVLQGEPFFESDPLWDRLYPRVQALESFHALFHHPDVLQVMRVLAGADPFVYPMKMLRIAAPRKMGYETPPHQDAYSHHAGSGMAGIWIGLHTVDASMGRLTVLPGSHRGGVRPVFKAQGVGGVQCEIYPGEDLWHVSDVEAGDVVLFHSCTVHRAQPNTGAQRVRLSVDTRFCNFGAPVFSTNLEPHHGWRIDDLDWNTVYRNWRSTELQYYWRDYPALF